MDEQKQAEASEENPDQLGPYQLQEQVPQATRGQTEHCPAPSASTLPRTPPLQGLRFG
jgi:hypothetical protein